MKTSWLVSAALSLLLFAGCESTPKTTGVALEWGMTREQVKRYFGEPLRIEPAANGSENWYYRFVAWKTHPIQEGGTSEFMGERTAYATVGVGVSKDTEECPVHISADGHVIGPVPKGKVVRNP